MRDHDPRLARATDLPRADGGARDSDPLAELARLIGQSDPFPEFERRRDRSGARDTRMRAGPVPPPPSWNSEGTAAPAGTANLRSRGASLGAASAGLPSPPADIDPSDYGSYAGYGSDYDPADCALDEAEFLEHERRRRRRFFAAAATILALVVLGGAGAYGLRTLFGPLPGAASPPVIAAENTRTKVIPEQKASVRTVDRLVYDPDRERGQKERLISREEMPLDVRTATVAPLVRSVPSAPAADPSVALPPPIARRDGDANASVLPVPSGPSGSGALLPSSKKVRTVTIRPDMSVVPSPMAPEKAASSWPATPAARPASSAASPPAPPAPPVSETVPVRSVAPPPVPLSLPQGSRTQPRSGPSVAAAPPPAASPAPKASGGYAVQVSSQRSETEANAAFRSLQARYPGVLDGKPSFVRRADLGTRGVFYRALVGPLATAEEAAELCKALKAAGGDCVIHRN